MEENKKTNPLADEQLDEVNGGRLDRELLIESESCLLYTSPSPRDRG